MIYSFAESKADDGSTLSNNPSAQLLTGWALARGQPLDAKLRRSHGRFFSALRQREDDHLRAIAGFVRPDSGQIASRAQVLFDSATRCLFPRIGGPFVVRDRRLDCFRT
jgi:hypothetical protein